MSHKRAIERLKRTKFCLLDKPYFSIYNKNKRGELICMSLIDFHTHVLPEMDVDAAAKLDQILLRKA